MIESILGGQGPVQIAYHVPDIDHAARRYAAEFGWGPFYKLEHIALEKSLYRGAPAHFDHSSAYGQAGDLMIEFITQHGDEPSCVRDMYEMHQTGIHHVAYFVEDLDDALSRATVSGYATALDGETASGVRFVMIDTVATFGHMVELYEANEMLSKFYAFVKRASVGWDGAEPVRPLSA